MLNGKERGSKGLRCALADACCVKERECPLAGVPAYGPGVGLTAVHLRPWRNVVAPCRGGLREARAIARDSMNGCCMTYTAFGLS